MCWLSISENEAKHTLEGKKTKVAKRNFDIPLYILYSPPFKHVITPHNFRLSLLLFLQPASNGPTLRANPFPKVTDLFCRIPLPTFTLSTRGYSPWRPVAVISTARLVKNFISHIECFNALANAETTLLLQLKFHGSLDMHQTIINNTLHINLFSNNKTSIVIKTIEGLFRLCDYTRFSG